MVSTRAGSLSQGMMFPMSRLDIWSATTVPRISNNPSVFSTS